MTTLVLPKPPEGLAGMTPHQAQSALSDWLMTTASHRGGLALDHALGAGWPGTDEQRSWIPDAHIEQCRNRAKGGRRR